MEWDIDKEDKKMMEPKTPSMNSKLHTNPIAKQYGESWGNTKSEGMRQR